MRAVLVDFPGPESSMRVGEADPPELIPGSVRIQVAATAVNRADLLQRRGGYPPPAGASEILGLECAGEVVQVAPGAERWKVGDRVMALLPGGGYAEQAVADAGSILAIPERMSFEQAAAIPEVFLTVFLNVFQLAGLREGGTALVHGGGSGIGTAAIQLVKAAGARVIVTCGTNGKCHRCAELGADVAVNYNGADFVVAVKETTGGNGVDVILDSIGAPYLERNIAALAVGGRLVLIGLMGGATSEINLGQLLVRRLQIIGSTLRARPVEEKAAIVAAFQERFGDALAKGQVDAVVDRVLPLDEVEEAHRVVRASEHVGKVVLKVG